MAARNGASSALFATINRGGHWSRLYQDESGTSLFKNGAGSSEIFVRPDAAFHAIFARWHANQSIRRQHPPDFCFAIAFGQNRNRRPREQSS